MSSIARLYEKYLLKLELLFREIKFLFIYIDKYNL